MGAGVLPCSLPFISIFVLAASTVTAPPQISGSSPSRGCAAFDETLPILNHATTLGLELSTAYRSSAFLRELKRSSSLPTSSSVDVWKTARPSDSSMDMPIRSPVLTTRRFCSKCSFSAANKLGWSRRSEESGVETLRRVTSLAEGGTEELVKRGFCRAVRGRPGTCGATKGVMRRCEGLPRFASRMGERYAGSEVLAGLEKLDMLILRSPLSDLFTGYRATFLDMFSG